MEPDRKSVGWMETLAKDDYRRLMVQLTCRSSVLGRWSGSDWLQSLACPLSLYSKSIVLLV